MEKCPELDREKPSQNPFRFHPPHRRRPLVSETYRTLLHILSHCTTRCEPQPTQQKQDEIGGTESGIETANGGSVDQHTKAETKILVNDDIDSEKRNSHAKWQEVGDISDAQMQDCIDLLDHIDDAMEVNGEVPLKNGVNSGISNSMVDNYQANTLAFQLHNEQGDKSNTPELHVQEPDLVKMQKMDKESSIHEACATLESCFLMDEDNDLSQLVQCSEEKSHVTEKSFLKDMKHGLQLKEMELQNLISASREADSSVCETAVKEIEEGEISGDTGVSDESYSCMFEDKVSLEQGHAHVSSTAEKEFIHDVTDSKLQEKYVLTSFSNDSADGHSNASKELLGKNSKEVEENDIEMVVYQKDVENKKIDGFDNVIDSEVVTELVDGVKNLDSFAACLPLKTTSLVNVTENQGFLTDTDVEDANETKKKKKRGPMTKERRAKKKAKERIKRAEKNRKLGVKRLKLPPIMKPKKVTYCRHFLKGRCQEGEKCNFSHDTIPLTKSKPCCHFARHSCMKGDDCPYDHQLSNYPCNNFVSNGFCSRGADCLFSHKVPVKTESLTAPTVSKAELKSSLPPSSLSPKMQVNAHGSSQPFPGKSTTEQTIGEPVQKLPVQAPKGVSFLTHGKSPVGDAKNKEDGASLEEGDSGKFSQVEIHSKPENTQKSNDAIRGPTSRIPQGINFLSFGRAPFTDSSSKTTPNLLNRDYGIGKLQLGAFSKSKDTASSPKSSDSIRNEMKASCSASPNQKTNRNLPKSTPPGISLLSFAEVSLDATSSMEQAIFSSKECITDSPMAEGNQGSLSGLNNNREMHFKLVSSSLPSNQLLGQSAEEHNVGMPISSKTTFLANIPSSAQKALQSSLAFAGKFESGIKLDQSVGASFASSNIKEHQ